MAPGDEYAPIGGGGKLKLKGTKVKDGRVDKKKKKRKEGRTEKTVDYHHHHRQKEEDDATTGGEAELETVHHQQHHQNDQGRDSVSEEPSAEREGKREGEGEDKSGAGRVAIYKTEAERRYEERRKKRLDERLRREGIKTHKERVEELNRYLSTLSEHHDMPKIGPG